MSESVEEKIQRLADDYNIQVAPTEQAGEANSNLNERYPDAEAISDIINEIEALTGKDHVIIGGPHLRGTGVLPVEELPEGPIVSSLPNQPANRGGTGRA